MRKLLLGAVAALTLMSGTSFASCSGATGYPSTATANTDNIALGGNIWSGNSLVATPCGSAPTVYNGWVGLEMQSDGDLKIIKYDSQQQVCQNVADSMYGLNNSCMLWHSNTAGHPGAFVALGYDGNFCIWYGGFAIWCTGTQSGTTYVNVGTNSLTMRDQYGAVTGTIATY